MTRIRVRLFVSYLILATLCSLAQNAPAVAAGCGLVPIAPLPPLGCKAMEPDCVCDQTGQNCQWVWHCIPQ